MNQKPFIIIVGRTATGKTTLAKALGEKGLTRVITHTTRPRRESEFENDYHFVDDVTKYENRVLETVINNHQYFMTRESLAEHDVLILDPKGAKEFVTLNPTMRPCLLVYLYVDAETRLSYYITRDSNNQLNGNDFMNHLESTHEKFHERNDSESSLFDEYERYILGVPEHIGCRHLVFLNEDTDYMVSQIQKQCQNGSKFFTRFTRDSKQLTLWED